MLPRHTERVKKHDGPSVSERRSRPRALPGRQRVEDLARRVHHGLRASDQRRTRLQVKASARGLSEVLVGPIANELGNHRLLVVGDGMLHYVPFAALPLPAGGEAEELLIDRYEVVHLPSAAVMKALRQRAAERATPARTLAVLADPVCSPQDERLPAEVRNADSPPDAWSPSFRILPYSRREAESILALVPAPQRRAALDFAASPELVKSGELSDYRILHFATHGLLDEVHPELSGVVLSMFDEDGRRRDGHLRLHEIYALQLPADLVVLSACRTALGRRVRGEGLVGLTHGLLLRRRVAAPGQLVGRSRRGHRRADDGVLPRSPRRGPFAPGGVAGGPATDAPSGALAGGVLLGGLRPRGGLEVDPPPFPPPLDGRSETVGERDLGWHGGL